MSLADTLGSLAVASQGQYMTGVSTDISTSFVKPAGKPGDELKMTATLTAMGMFIHSNTRQRLTLSFSQGNRWHTHGLTSSTPRDSWSLMGVGSSLYVASTVLLTKGWD